MTYGAVYGVPVGARFQNRRSLYDAKIHRDIQRGICGGPDRKRGAESLVLSGGYEDDLDLGDIIYYTGIGKRDARGRLTANQEFTGINRSLAMNAETFQPVRLVRSVTGEYEYAGLFVVEDAFLRPGKRGFLICQYRLRSLQQMGAYGGEKPTRTEVQRVLKTHYQLARDREVPARIKAMYGYECQVCGILIDTLAGPYSEGAHIVPLGGGAEGPDVGANVLSLCPNHHVMLDHGAIYLTDDWHVFDRLGRPLGKLKVHPEHDLDPSYARAHRQLMGFRESVGGEGVQIS